MSNKAAEAGYAPTTELIEKLVTVVRTSKVVKGGRIFGFTGLVVIGDGKGRVGYGMGKSREVPSAIQKATEQARRNMQRFILAAGGTVEHEIIGRHGATRVWMQPASEGTGVIAGSAMRAVFEVMGIENILAKCISSSTNPFNVVRATFDALIRMNTPQQVAAKRGKTMSEIREGTSNE